MSNNLFRFGEHKAFEKIKEKEMLNRKRKTKFFKFFKITLLASTTIYLFKSFNYDEIEFYIHSK